MESLGTREVPVVEERALVGILTRTDMEPYRGHFEWTAVRSAMTPDPVTVLPDAPIREVLNLFLDRGFNCVPVSAGGELLGIIYPPQVAIVGFGRIAERPWSVEGRIVSRPVVNATLSADHRVTDGHRAGLFLAAFERLLQEPEKL
jgi:hypothetical protein